MDLYRLQQQLLELMIFLSVQTSKKDFHRIDQFLVAYFQLPPAFGGQYDTVATVVDLVLGPPDERLALQSIQDCGGPIGLSYAVRNRGSLRGLVVMNSWAWEASIPQKLFSLVMGGWPLGYWLQTRHNFFARSIVPHGIHHKEKLVPSLRKAYTGPFPTAQSRIPTWVFPRHIRKAGCWLRELETQLDRLADLPTQILCGSRDEPGFRKVELARWQRHLLSHETEVLDDASHFIQEDRPERVVATIVRLLARTQHQQGNA